MYTILRNLRVIGVALITWALILACAPTNVTDQPRFVCPTPTPEPTEVKDQVRLPTATPNGPQQYEYTYYEPYEKEYGRDPQTGAVRTPTPYIRTGSDFYAGQRVQVGPFVVRVTGYHTGAAAPHPGQAYHYFDLTVENQSSAPVEAHFEAQSMIRRIKQPDGQLMSGQWTPSGAALQAGGQQQWFPGIWDAGATHNLTVAFEAPAGDAQEVGFNFAANTTGNTNAGSSAGNMVWITNRPDPHCGDPGVIDPAAGGPAPADPPPPARGRHGLPVRAGTPIARGYGCHPFFTGVQDGCGSQWWHDGIDFSDAIGVPLFAVTDATVTHAGEDTTSSIICNWGMQPPHRGFGNYIRLVDSDNVQYDYGHVSAWYVHPGDHVQLGQVIGRIGATGCSTGPHVHFRVKVNGRDVVPWPYIGGQ